MLTYAETVLAARREAELAGRARHLRQGRRRAERRQRHPLPGARLARLPRRRPGDPGHASSPRSSRPRRSAAERDGIDLRVVRESFTPVVEFEHALRDELAEILGAAAGPRARHRRGTRRGHSVRRRSRPPCCSYGTRPASRTPRPSSPPRTTAWPGCSHSPTYWRAWRAADDRPTGWSTPGSDTHVEPGVALEVGGRAGSPPYARVSRPPPPGADVLRGLTLPGLANAHSHAFHRALRGTVQVGSGTFWTWREVMYQVASRLTPDTYFELARAVYAEMALAGITYVGEFHYLHHAPGGMPVRRPERDGRGADRGRRRGRDPDHPARHGLSLRQASAQARPNEHQLRFSDGTAEAWAERVSALKDSDHARIGAADPLRTGRPRRRSWARSPNGPRARRAPLHVHLSEQTAENDACLAAHGCTPTRLLADHGVLGAAHHRRPPHPPHRRGHRAAGLLRHRHVHVPHHGTRPGGRHRPGGRAAARGLPALPRHRQPRRDRPPRRGPRDGAERTAAHPHPRPLDGGGPAARRHRGRPRRAGLAGRRPHRARRARRLHDGGAGLGPHGGRRCRGWAPRRRSSRRPSADVRHTVVGGRHVVRDGAHTLVPDVPQALADAIDALRPEAVPAAHAAPARDRALERPARPRHRARAPVTRKRPATRPPPGDGPPPPAPSSPTSAAWSPTTPPSATAPSASSTDAAVVIDGDRVAWVGAASKHPPPTPTGSTPAGRAAIPGFVDSHSHLVFAGDRTEEFNARMSGRAYTAGGIRTTVAATRAATDEALRSATSPAILGEALRQGTTTFETKSGYGLTVEDEARALRIAAEHTDEVTYLGAHIVAARVRRRPRRLRRPGHRRDARRLRSARPLGRRLLRARAPSTATRPAPSSPRARPRACIPRVHANQLGHGPGVQLAVELGAASADHCTHLTDADVDALAGGDTVATLLPGAEFSTRPPSRTPAGCWTRAPPSRCPPDCNPARPSPPPCRSASPWPYGTWG